MQQHCQNIHFLFFGLPLVSNFSSARNQVKLKWNSQIEEVLPQQTFFRLGGWKWKVSIVTVTAAINTCLLFSKKNVSFFFEHYWISWCFFTLNLSSLNIFVWMYYFLETGPDKFICTLRLYHPFSENLIVCSILYKSGCICLVFSAAAFLIRPFFFKTLFHNLCNSVPF